HYWLWPHGRRAGTDPSGAVRVRRGAHCRPREQSEERLAVHASDGCGRSAEPVRLDRSSDRRGSDDAYSCSIARYGCRSLVCASRPARPSYSSLEEGNASHYLGGQHLGRVLIAIRSSVMGDRNTRAPASLVFL